jgi:hypothetical protein
LPTARIRRSLGIIYYSSELVSRSPSELWRIFDVVETR